MRRGFIIYFFRRALSVSGAPRPSASASSLLSLAWKTRENKTCFHTGCARPRQTWRPRGRIAHKLSLQNFLDREARAKRRESGRVAYHSPSPWAYCQNRKWDVEYVRYSDCQVALYLGSFLFIYFAITGVKEIVRFTEDFVI